MIRMSLTASALVLLSGPAPGAATTVLTVTENVIVEKGDSKSFDEWAVALDGKRVAWPVKNGKLWSLHVDGTPLGAGFKEIEDIRFSPDGASVMYRAKQDKNWVAVVDGKPGAPYREIEAIGFGPHSRRIAYHAKQGKGWVAVVDEKAGNQYHEVGAIRFSRDGGRFAYRAEKQKSWVVVVDHREGAEYDEVRSPVFSIDGRHVAYAAKRDKRWRMLVDGEELGPEMRDASSVIGFSPESEAPIFVGSLDDQGWSVFQNGEPGPDFALVSIGSSYEPGGVLRAYAGARRSGNRFTGSVVIEGEEGPPFEGDPIEKGTTTIFIGSWQELLASSIAAGVAAALTYESGPGLERTFTSWGHGVSSPDVSPDGEHFAYGARREKKDYVVFLDGEPGPSFERGVCNPVFGPDGKLYYVGFDKDALYRVVDGEKGRALDWEGYAACSPMRFTDDGAHSAIIVERGRTEKARKRLADRQLFVDGRAEPKFEAIWLKNITFFSDAERFHWAYFVRAPLHERKDVSFAMFDRFRGKDYDEVLPGSLRFEDASTLTFIARTSGRILRVTHRLPGPASSTVLPDVWSRDR